ncbi:hypothetical protein GC197_13780 [bacterium]|nr:hypothetical protein [bacterium]
MARETILALDLEGTLISNAVSQFPRPGLRQFLGFCGAAFESVYLYTAVRDERCGPIIQRLVEERFAPDWLLGIPLVQWDRSLKDLGNIPGVSVNDCLIVDDNPDYILEEQRSQWIAIAKFESPYPDTDRELEQVQRLLAERLAIG